jgi:hypothetical protein
MHILDGRIVANRFLLQRFTDLGFSPLIAIKYRFRNSSRSGISHRRP